MAELIDMGCLKYKNVISQHNHQSILCTFRWHLEFLSTCHKGLKYADNIEYLREGEICIKINSHIPQQTIYGGKAILLNKIIIVNSETISHDFFLTVSTLRLMQGCGLFMHFFARGARAERQK